MVSYAIEPQIRVDIGWSLEVKGKSVADYNNDRLSPRGDALDCAAA
jgi:hypothetical protein